MTAAEDFVAEWLDPSPIYLDELRRLMSGAAKLVQAQLVEIERLRDLVRQAHQLHTTTDRWQPNSTAPSLPTYRCTCGQALATPGQHADHVRALLDPECAASTPSPEEPA